MAKIVLCSECGTRLSIIPKAIKDYGVIVHLVPPHECPDEPIDLDLQPQEIPRAKGKFVENLNNLRPPLNPSISTMDLRDRRTEKSEVKTTAPASILEHIKSGLTSSPEGNIDQEPEGS